MSDHLLEFIHIQFAVFIVLLYIKDVWRLHHLIHRHLTVVFNKVLSKFHQRVGSFIVIFVHIYNIEFTLVSFNVCRKLEDRFALEICKTILFLRTRHMANPRIVRNNRTMSSNIQRLKSPDPIKLLQ